MSIITPEDVRVYLNHSTMSGGASPACQAIIDGLQGDLEAFLGRPVTVREFTEEPVIPSIGFQGRIKLRRTPVVSVDSVTADGVAVGTGYYSVKPWGLSSVTFVGTVGTLTSPPVLSVTYTAGLDGENPDDPFGMVVKGKLLRAAAREYAKVVQEGNVGVESVSVEGESIRYAQGIDGWSEDELKSMIRWKRR